MKKTVCFIATAVILFMAASCGNKNAQESVVKEVNPLWGMWLRQSPATTSKMELMFNEDSTGFVFNADTLLCELRWVQSNLLNVEFVFESDSATDFVEQSYTPVLVADTLTLFEFQNGKASPLQTRYQRVRE